MKPKNLKSLAARIRENPSLFEMTDDLLLGELIHQYVGKELSPEDTSAVEALLKSDERAKVIHARICAARAAAAACDARDLFRKALDSVKVDKRHEWTSLQSREHRPASPLAGEREIVFGEALRQVVEVVQQLFRLATASTNDSRRRELPDKTVSVEVSPDDAGRLWLHVSSTRAEFGSRSFRLEVDAPELVLKFRESAPGLFEASTVVSDEVANAILSGAIVKLIPL